MSPLLALLVGALPVLFGLAVLRHALTERREARAFAGRAVRTEAVVVGLAERRVEGNELTDWLFHPVLRFHDAAGQPVEVESAVGQAPAAARPGQTVEVLYDPADPTTARLAGEGANDLLVAVGTGLVVTGVLVALLLSI